MKIFVTGGTGFIGTHFLQIASQNHCEITALCRPESQLFAGANPETIWWARPMDQIDVTDLAGVDVLVHLASPGVAPKKASWEELFYWNVTVLLRLMEQAKLAEVRRIVIAGTFAEYGRSADLYDFIPCDAPLHPTYAYAASKAAGCVAATAYAIEEKMELCYLRIFSAYGEGQFEENFWPSLKKAAEEGRDFPMTFGEQVRDYVPVEQVALAFLDAGKRDDVIAGIPLIKNVGSGHPISIKDFARHWWKRWNASGQILFGALPYRQNEIMRCVAKID